MSKFFIALSAYSLFLFALCKFAAARRWSEMPRDADTVIISSAVFTALLYLTLVYFQKKLSERFPLAYLASVTFKLAAGMIFLFFFIRRNPHGKALAVLFLLAYAGFTAIEVFFLRKRLTK